MNLDVQKLVSTPPVGECEVKPWEENGFTEANEGNKEWMSYERIAIHPKAGIEWITLSFTSDWTFASFVSFCSIRFRFLGLSNSSKRGRAADHPAVSVRIQKNIQDQEPTLKTEIEPQITQIDTDFEEIASSLFNPKSNVTLCFRAEGTTEALRATERTEFEEYRNDSFFDVQRFFSVDSVVLSLSVVSQQ